MPPVTPKPVSPSDWLGVSWNKGAFVGPEHLPFVSGGPALSNLSRVGFGVGALQALDRRAEVAFAAQPCRGSWQKLRPLSGSCPKRLNVRDEARSCR